jgi:hypothetical protein
VVSGTPFLVATQPGAGFTFYQIVSVTDSKGCIRTTGFTAGSASATITAIPQTASFTGNTICDVGTGTLTFTRSSNTNPNPFTIVYTDGTNNFTATGVTSGTAFNVSSNPTSTTTYTLVSVTDNNGCVRNTGFTAPTATITINPALANNTFSAISTTICSGTSPGVLTGSTPTGGNGTFNYTWQNSLNGTTFNNIGGATAINFTPPTLTVNTWYQRTVTSVGVQAFHLQKLQLILLCCNNAATASICSGTLNITLTASIASSFSWTIGTITGSITGKCKFRSIYKSNINKSERHNRRLGSIYCHADNYHRQDALALFTITVTVNPAPTFNSLTVTRALFVLEVR